ncbi:hypothetical protein JHK82_039660 [Glycine max]|uniref:Uncharacterized protein n=1 Tax=Glycine max TaxID=3847 RepID=K7M6H7_SOYBN|nr:hypothetical protein JHK82_039660 [Glycine max]KAH1094290.1 hypothetical protein GYH30_039825 [Glycine max]KRH16078.1 hypothetical protein GLYMA_14G130600v4 [Glycine max]
MSHEYSVLSVPTFPSFFFQPLLCLGWYRSDNPAALLTWIMISFLNIDNLVPWSSVNILFGSEHTVHCQVT